MEGMKHDPIWDDIARRVAERNEIKTNGNGKAGQFMPMSYPEMYKKGISMQVYKAIQEAHDGEEAIKRKSERLGRILGVSYLLLTECIHKYTGAIIKTSYVTSEFQKRNAFIIAVGDSYLSGFHAKQDWDTLRELYGKELGSFEDLNALDFTTDIKNAWLFGSFEGAADFARKIEHLCTPRIMKCEYTQKIHD